jgi:Hint domain-containing protein
MHGQNDEADRKPDGSVTRRSLFGAAAVAASAIGALALGARRANAGPGGRVGGGGGGGQCYLAGTHILTPDGPREIGLLSIGDRVTTLSGDAKPIKWIGRNRFVRQADGTWPSNALPVKVARFALDGHSPSADLYLSPGHAVYVDGLLIQVGSLVNGTSIARDPAADRQVLEYFHIELAEHDVVFAEGAATETLLPSADRRLFDNWREYEALYGAEPVAPARPFATEIHLSGARAHLRSRLRSAVSPWIDRRQPFDVVRDRLEQRAQAL